MVPRSGQAGAISVPTGGRPGPLALSRLPPLPSPGAPEPGYEVVAVGPTTNFVGDAMTRGAVDLVMVGGVWLRNLQVVGMHVVGFVRCRSSGVWGWGPADVVTRRGRVRLRVLHGACVRVEQGHRKEGTACPGSSTCECFSVPALCCMCLNSHPLACVWDTAMRATPFWHDTCWMCANGTRVTVGRNDEGARLGSAW